MYTIYIMCTTQPYQQLCIKPVFIQGWQKEGHSLIKQGQIMFGVSMLVSDPS